MPDDGARPSPAVPVTSPVGDVTGGDRRRHAGMMWTLALRRFRSHLRTTGAPTDTEDTDGRAR